MNRRFYRMAWDTTDVPPYLETEGFAVLTPTPDITIYGYEVEEPEFDSERFPDRVYGKWFSQVSPTGDYGSNPLAACEEITEADFDQARKDGWPHVA